MGRETELDSPFRGNDEGRAAVLHATKHMAKLRLTMPPDASHGKRGLIPAFAGMTKRERE